jgi:peptidoglycan hydrolase CwlO-like protein
MTTPPMDVLLVRLEGKVDVLTERVSSQGHASGETARQLQRGLDEVKSAVQQAREEARRDSSAVRVALERQIAEVNAELTAHIDARNPHAAQEEWIRAGISRGETADAVREGWSAATKWLVTTVLAETVAVGGLLIEIFRPR